MGTGRTRAERDAVTVEMVYAAVTGALMAVAGFVAVSVPVFSGEVHGHARKGCLTVAVVVAAALFCGRIAITLRRFERQNALRGSEPAPREAVDAGVGAPARVPRQRGSGADSGGPPDQPSQPGRTSPDS